MKISIFGMGYVGTTTAACLLDNGHEIIGVDIDILKIERLNYGKAPMIKERGISELLYKGYCNGLLKATSNPLEGIIKCDIILVCVGTPSNFDGSINLSYIKNVIKDIGRVLKNVNDRPLIVIRSTCLPGTMENDIKPLLEQYSNLIVDKDIDLVFHPEFLREGMAVYDFKNPSKIVVGESRKGAADLLLNIYNYYNVPFFRLNYKEAEMVKYCDNIFHALKITFANEIASISNFIGIDPRKIADVYCSDYILNISSAYLYPGFAYGGSCLPKDLKAMLRFASLNCIQIPMLSGIQESNRIQIDNFIKRILLYSPNKVGMVGIAFKTDTDDIRESPYVEVAKALIGEGIELKIYDKFISSEELIGSNKKQIQKAFKNIDSLLVSSLDDLLIVDLIIINHSIVDSKQIKKWVDKNIKVIDIANIKGIDFYSHNYEGIYW